MQRPVRDRGALTTALLAWIAGFLVLAVLFASLGWAGVFTGDESAESPGTIVPTDWTGMVRDSLTGDPLGGVTVTPTDVSGAPISSLAVVTAANGSYLIPALTFDEYGLFVDGGLVAHAQGYVASGSGPFGHHVVDTWGAAATYAPGVFGDIALDPIEVPTSTVPESTVASTVPESTAEANTSPTTTAAANHGPDIGAITANPALVSPSRLCGVTTTSFAVEVVDPDGVKSVVVQWSYPTGAAGAAAGTASGASTLTRVAGTNRWEGASSFWQQPRDAQTAITLKVVATDHLTMYRSRSFDHSLTIKRC